MCPTRFARAVLYRDGIASTLEAEAIMKRVVLLVAVLVALVGNVSSAWAQCGSAQVIAPTCGAITWEGCCTGNVATWCDDEEAGGPLCGRDCGLCTANRKCLELEDYVSVPAFLRQAMAAYGLAEPEPKGIYQ